MKHIRILHLYSNALDLYGDYKNLTVLQRRIAEIGNTSDITEINLDEVIDPTGYDFVYIGHGKARNLAAVAPHFVQYGDTIRTAIEGGQVWGLLPAMPENCLVKDLPLLRGRRCLVLVSLITLV